MDENHAKYKKMIEDTDKRLKGLMAKWVLRYDYFGFLFSLIRRRALVNLPHPAAMAPTPQGTLELLYNPILIAATPDADLHELLHHEGLHVLNKHISRMMRILADLEESKRKKHNAIINTAADCCVNHQGKIRSPLMIAGSPFYLHFPENHGLEPDRMMEEYYYTLLERERKKEKRNQDSGDDNKEKSENPDDEKSPGDKNDSSNKKDDKSNDGKSDDSQTNDKDSDQELFDEEDEHLGGGDGDGDGKDGDGDGKDGSGDQRNPGRGKSPGRGKPTEEEGSPSRGNM